MARLNDAPPAAESVDALKRRFVRQNRELARINSNQSVRIRNLEIEISRLLSENIAYRERVIKLQHEVGRSPGLETRDSIGKFRSQLESKLADLTGLVQELGTIQQNLEPRRVSRRRSIQRSSPKRSPDQRNWKNALGFSEVAGVVDGRLPPIAEDKYYPRRTLESEELREILNTASKLDSPDLGPPPIASWENPDRVKSDSEPTSPIREIENRNDDSIKLPLLANLETRKKRRESTQHSASVRSTPRDMQPTHYDKSDEAFAQPLKAGAKRKLNARDEETRNGLTNALKSNSLFDRKAESQNTVADQPTTAATDHSRLGTARTRAPGTAESCENDKGNLAATTNRPRQVLGPKCVNTDPLQSPAKAKQTNVHDRLSDSKHSAYIKPRDRDRSIEKLSSRKERNSTNERVPTTMKTSEVPPEAPAAPSLDVLSLPSSEKLASRPGSRDTPPPPDLNPEASAADIFGAAGRATRRARGSISYAEPSLRDKMRRPTKELIDAVGADDRPQIIKVQQNPIEPRHKRTQTMIVKQEDAAENEDWKSLPIATQSESQTMTSRTEPKSPLTIKAIPNPTEDLPATVATSRPRGDSMSIERSDSTLKPVSKAGSTIAALVSGTQKGKKLEEITEMKKHEAKDIFELYSSSPYENAVATTAAATRGSRRHSTVSANVDIKDGGLGADGTGSRRGERRRGSAKPVAREASEGEGEMNQLKSTNSVRDLGETGMGRRERAAGRRRSMML